MKNFYLFICSFFILPTSIAFAGDNHSATNTEAPMQSALIKLSDQGIEPNSLTLPPDTSVVFVLNDTSDSLATLSLDFKKRTVHCSGGTLRANEEGVLQSIRPFGPKDFASFCFHEKGKYDLVVYGLKNRPAGIKSQITVE